MDGLQGSENGGVNVCADDGGGLSSQSGKGGW